MVPLLLVREIPHLAAGSSWLSRSRSRTSAHPLRQTDEPACAGVDRSFHLSVGVGCHPEAGGIVVTRFPMMPATCSTVCASEGGAAVGQEMMLGPNMQPWHLEAPQVL
uniref:Uncharacterized protein n=1 Tax=Oryza meridionalis TaxID=40149 RepID=A0A0E0EC92_9ORYZ